MLAIHYFVLTVCERKTYNKCYANSFVYYKKSNLHCYLINDIRLNYL